MQIDLMRCQLKCAINFIRFAPHYRAIGWPDNLERAEMRPVNELQLANCQWPIEFAAMSVSELH